MSRRWFAFCMFMILGRVAGAEVLVLQDNLCLDKVEIKANREGIVYFLQDGRLYSLNSKFVVRVEEVAPPGSRSLVLKDFPDYIARQTAWEAISPEATAAAAEARENTGEASGVSAALSGKVISGRSFQIDDIQRVDDQDLLWRFGMLGGYLAEGESRKTEDSLYTQTPESSWLFFNTAFAWQGTTRMADWQMVLPGWAHLDPHRLGKIKDSHDLNAYEVDSHVMPRASLMFYPGEFHAGTAVQYLGNFNSRFAGERLQAEAQIGFGRLFTGRHAYQAIQIIHELKAHKTLLKSVSDDDMQELCALLTRKSGRYLFDKRSENFAVTSAVGNFLRDKGYINTVDGILLAADTYQYLPNVERDFGFQMFFRTSKLHDRMSGFYTMPAVPENGLGRSSSDPLFAYARSQLLSEIRQELYGDLEREEGSSLGLGLKAAVPLSRVFQLDIDGGLDIMPTYSAEYRPLSISEFYNGMYYVPAQYGRDHVENDGMLLAPYLNCRLSILLNTRMYFQLSNQLQALTGSFKGSRKVPQLSYGYYYYDYSTYTLEENYTCQRNLIQENLRAALIFQLSETLSLEASYCLFYSYRQQGNFAGISTSDYDQTQTRFSEADVQSVRYGSLAGLQCNYRLF